MTLSNESKAFPLSHELRIHPPPLDKGDGKTPTIGHRISVRILEAPFIATYTHHWGIAYGKKINLPFFLKPNIFVIDFFLIVVFPSVFCSTVPTEEDRSLFTVDEGVDVSGFFFATHITDVLRHIVPGKKLGLLPSLFSLMDVKNLDGQVRTGAKVIFVRNDISRLKHLGKLDDLASGRSSPSEGVSCIRVIIEASYREGT